MDYHEYTIQKHLEEEEEKDRLMDAIDKVLEKIEKDYPNILPENFDECYKIGEDIVINDYNIDSYMEDYINKHKENNNENNCL